MNNIRNFSIIAHIDHGKSTLADRMLEITHTVEARKMHDRVLDDMELEKERGITIKMRPVRMVYHPRRLTQTEAQTYADLNTNKENTELLYEDLSYKIRGAVFAVKKELGLGHKEFVYHKALEIEFRKIGLNFESEKIVNVEYEGEKVGTYIPDFIIDEKIIIELKALPEIGKPQEEQVWSYLKGSTYKLAILVNFGSTDVNFKRIVFDSAREKSASSASSQSESAFQSASSASSQRQSAQVQDEYILNLIDTPGHIDFYYEVSRALKAVEGSILLVDATQGVQAQTLTTLAMARESGLVIIPVITKIDSPLSRVDEVKYEIMKLIDCNEDDIICVSGRTGEGVDTLLQEVIKRVPAPKTVSNGPKDVRALIFDFQYSTHTGVIVFIRLFDGKIKKGDQLLFKVANEKFIPLEVGTFNPAETPKDELSAGEIGYIVTGIKRPGIASVGDTITSATHPLSELHGYMTPAPVVWASVYTESQDDFNGLRQALERLRLSDSSYAFEEESSGSLGRGFRCGFLGMLHLEIITERLRREFNLNLIVTTPSITYIVTNRQGKKETIYSPSKFPEFGEVTDVEEPWIHMTIITPPAYISGIMQMLFDHEAEIGNSENFGDDRTSIEAMMPLRELMRNFFDELKSVTSGYASLSYEIGEFRKADVCRLDILINGEPMIAFTRIVSKRRVEEDGRKTAEKLQKVMPQQMIIVKIQAKALGRIIASETLSALRKDVTQHMYGGDITRKMKLREKQKKGKKKMQEMGNVNITHEVFLKMMKSD